MSLTHFDVKNASCPEGKKQIKISDGDGLFLLVKANGSKLWRFRFKFAGKHQEMALGNSSIVSLANARKLKDEARLLISQGLNPMTERKKHKEKEKEVAKSITFSKVASNWFTNQSDKPWSDEYRTKIERWLASLDTINELPIDEIDAGHIAELFLYIESNGQAYISSPLLSILNRIFSYALAHRHTRINPAQGIQLKDILKARPKVKNLAAITTPQELAQLIYDIDNDTNKSASYCVIQALQLLSRVFLRPTEIRHLKWEYIDFEERLIRIPNTEMKRMRDHLVPLATQVYEQLLEIKKVTGYSKYVFPSERNSDKPISKNVLTNRLRSLGYSSGVMTAHGFRSTASTILNEQGKNEQAIEAQLAHLTGTATSRTYNRSIYLEERRVMMQDWADYLDEIKASV